MKSSYDLFRSIRCCVPAPSVCFGVGAWMVTAGQSSWGKGAVAGEEARRGRKATPEWWTGASPVHRMTGEGACLPLEVGHA